MEIPQATDLTRMSQAAYRVTEQYRAALATTYLPGSLVKTASQDAQIYTDGKTVVPTAAVAADVLLQGIVSEDWKGFSGADPIVTNSNANAGSRGTQAVKVTTYGYHAGALVDQGGAGAAALSNGSFLHSSTRTPGRVQAVAASVAGALVGYAVLPAAGLMSAITAAALAQASATVTIAGVPAAGDTITVNLQTSFAGTLSNLINPGIANIISVATVLTAAQAASATTAATAVVSALNANAAFAKYFIASNAAGVITIAVNALSVPFLVSYLSGGAFTISLSGSAGNGLTLTSSAVGGSTVAVSGNLAGGAGFFGALPVFVTSL